MILQVLESAQASAIQDENAEQLARVVAKAIEVDKLVMVVLREMDTAAPCIDIPCGVDCAC
jgi:hypothetical protein